MIKDIKYVGFELWQVKAGSIFDNIIVTDSLAEAKKLAEETWGKLKAAEKEMMDKIKKVRERRGEGGGGGGSAIGAAAAAARWRQWSGWGSAVPLADLTLDRGIPTNYRTPPPQRTRTPALTPSPRRRRRTRSPRRPPRRRTTSTTTTRRTTRRRRTRPRRCDLSDAGVRVVMLPAFQSRGVCQPVARPALTTPCGRPVPCPFDTPPARRSWMMTRRKMRRMSSKQPGPQRPGPSGQ